jgi:hypothetical protein
VDGWLMLCIFFKSDAFFMIEHRAKTDSLRRVDNRYCAEHKHRDASIGAASAPSFYCDELRSSLLMNSIHHYLNAIHHYLNAIHHC